MDTIQAPAPVESTMPLVHGIDASIGHVGLNGIVVEPVIPDASTPERTAGITPVEFDHEVPLTYNAALEAGNTLPFSPDHLSGMLVAAVKTTSEYNQLDTERGTISRVSEGHGRSFEVAHVLFDDVAGNRFGTISLKGGGPYETRAHMAYSADDLGYTPIGFASNAASRRVVEVSRYLREEIPGGVDTEYILAIGRPDHFPVVQDDGSIKQMTMEEVYQSIDPDTQIPEDHQLNVYLRATRTAVRFGDLEPERKTKERHEGYVRLADNWDAEDKQRALDAMTILANDMALTAKGGDEEVLFDPTSAESRRHFITHTFPSRLGEAVAKIHRARLVHNSLTAGNALGSGGLVDLDSVTGPVLGFGDRNPMPLDALVDVAFVMKGIDPSILSEEQKKIYGSDTQCLEVVESLSRSGLLSDVESEEPYGSIRRQESDDNIEAFRTAFMNAYIKYGEGDEFVEAVAGLYEREHQKRETEMKNRNFG